jgi:hypothetical protein
MSEINYEAEAELERLIQSLESVIDAKRELKEASDAYTGYSPGWALRGEIDCVKDAVADFGNRLGAVIDRRVEAKIDFIMTLFVIKFTMMNK